MKRFTNLSTRAKLFFSFGTICAMLLIMITIAYNSLRSITLSEKKLHNVHFEIAYKLRELRSHQNFNRAAVLEMMMTKDPAGQKALVKVIEERAREYDIIFESLSKLEFTPTFQDSLKILKKEVEDYRQIRENQISLILGGNNEEAWKISVLNQKDQFEKIRSLSAKLGDEALLATDNQLIIDQEKANLLTWILGLIGLFVFIFSIFIIMLLDKTIARPLNEITKAAECIAKGDLSVRLPDKERKDEVGMLIQSFANMINSLQSMSAVAKKIASGILTETIVPQSDKDVLGNTFLQMLNNLRHIMKDITESINLLTSSSSEILAATTQVASGSVETATAITETTSTVEEVRQAAQLSNQKAKHVTENAKKVTEVAQNGQQAVNETITGMHGIQSQMETVATTIIRLSEQSQQIGGIIATVTDIADQSNLLAVNAAIEAAKAGEHGKGFSVVAQEIKDLAQQSKQATIQVRNILMEIQKSTSVAVMATEQTSKAIESGVKQSGDAGEAIKNLAESSDKALEAATQITASSQQQTIGMDQIGVAMQNINQAGAENAASMQQAEKAAKDLNELGLKLKALVEQYQI